MEGPERPHVVQERRIRNLEAPRVREVEGPARREAGHRGGHQHPVISARVDETAMEPLRSVNDASVRGGRCVASQRPEHRDGRGNPIAFLQMKMVSVDKPRLAVGLRREDGQDREEVRRARSPLRTRTRFGSVSTLAPNERNRSTIRVSPSGESASSPSTVTSPSVIAAATSGNAAEEKSPGMSTSVGVYDCPPSIRTLFFVRSTSTPKARIARRVMET